MRRYFSVPTPRLYSIATWGKGCLLLAALAFLSGCTSSQPGTDQASDGQPEEVLLEPYDAPSLEDLNAQAKWKAMPVLDGIDLLRERQKGEEELATVEEALSLENDSQENNAKILSALGRLPKQDSDVDYDATIVRHSPMDVKSTNPLMGSSVAEFDVTELTGAGLFGFDWNFTPFGDKGYVVSWEQSEDMLYDKIVMRDDLVWSDGKPLTAEDVMFSFQTIMNPKVPIPAVRSGTDKLRWVQAYADPETGKMNTVVYFHKEALATNVWNINFPLIPKHIYENSVKKDPTLSTSDYHANLERNPVSGGPYKLVKRQTGQEIVLERRENFFFHQGKQVRPLSYPKTVRFKVIEDPNTTLLSLKAGDVDECALNAEQWQSSQTTEADFYEKNTRATGVEWVYFYFCWNTKVPFFSDKRVRTAMAYAFDHEEMLNKIFYGLYEPSTGIFHPTSKMAPKPAPLPFTQDLKQAGELLDEAGWDDSDGDGIRDKEIEGRLVPFEFSILCPAGNPNSIKVCTLLKDNLRQVGIICNVKTLEFTVLQEQTRTHKFQAFMGGWGTGADPDTSRNVWMTGEGRNYGNYSNPEVDRLFDEAAKEFDQEKRAEMYAKIHMLLWEDQPYTWLFFRNSFYGFNKKLRGYNFSPRGPYGYSPGFRSLWVPAVSS
ncbi:MAG: peptide-binding protein [Pirellulaceae bacterium]